MLKIKTKESKESPLFLKYSIKLKDPLKIKKRMLTAPTIFDLKISLENKKIINIKNVKPKIDRIFNAKSILKPIFSKTPAAA